MARSEFCCAENVVHEAAVAEVRAAMHDAAALDTVAGFFRVLGDGTRMRIISALQVRELCVCDIAAALGMTKSAVSHQLSTLRAARLVKCRREGKSVFYSIDDEHVLKMLEGGLEHVHE